MATTELSLNGVMGKPHSFLAKTEAVEIDAIIIGTITLASPVANSVALSLPATNGVSLSSPAANNVDLNND